MSIKLTDWTTVDNCRYEFTETLVLRDDEDLPMALERGLREGTVKRVVVSNHSEEQS